jgi:hypothetical protein
LGYFVGEEIFLGFRVSRVGGAFFQNSELEFEFFASGG